MGTKGKQERPFVFGVLFVVSMQFPCQSNARCNQLFDPGAPTTLSTPLVLHLPHASTAIPAAALADYCVPPHVLSHELARLTDWYTDELFGDRFAPEQIVRAPVSRLVVDVERFADDADEPCARLGMGAVYVSTSDGAPLRRVSAERRVELLEAHYWPHHRALDLAAQASLEEFGRCIIMDAHSFPTIPLRTQRDFGVAPEIGIGTDPTHTSPALRDFAVTFFQDRGFSTGVDTPFSGTMVPNAHYQQDARVQSIMIEVRRDLYLDEATTERGPGFGRVQAVLTEFRVGLEALSMAG